MTRTRFAPALFLRIFSIPPLLISILLFFAGTAAYGGPGPEPGVMLDADKQFEYAQHCFKNDQFSCAADEFQRFSYFFPEDPRVPEAMYNAGMAYFFQDDYLSAIRQFEKIFKKFSDQEIAIDSALQISRSYRMMGNDVAAIDILRQVAALTGDARIKNRILSHLGWLYLETGDLANSRKAFTAISEKDRPLYHVDELLPKIENEHLIDQKSPLAAGMASIIPGGGYLYTGRYRDALFAFLLNGALGYAAYESFDNDLYALGGILSAVGIGFYSGSIYGGIQSAHKYNDEKKRQYIGNLKRYSEINIKPAGMGLCLSFSYHF